MKRPRQNFLKTIAAVISSVILCTSVQAATYIATVSGNFSAGATWGGTAPGTLSGNTITISGADLITINPGVTVTLDKDVIINNPSASLTITGRLISGTNTTTLTITGGALAGLGSMSVDSLAIGGTAVNVTASGNDTAQKLTILSTGFIVGMPANIYVAKSLYLTSGTLSQNSGQLILGTNATVNVNGGTLAISGSGLLNANNYNVVYTGGSATAGSELSGTGLGKVTVNVSSSASVTLSSNLTVKDTMTLISGELALNGKDLTFVSNGNFSGVGSGTINSTSSSNTISFNANNDFAGGLRFSTSGNSVGNIIMNMASAKVTLASDVNVSGQLALQTGKLITNNKITIAQGATVIGGSPSSYVVTAGTGSMAMYFTAGDSAAFHIGTATNYAPAVIAANSTSATGYVTASVNPTVYLNGTSGTSLSATESIVDATWYISSSVTTGISYNMYLIWNTSMEVHGFDRTKAYISHYTAGAWDKVAVSAAASMSGMYAIGRSNITSLSPFAVADANASMTNVPFVAQDKNGVVYPNPATTSLSFKSPVKVDRIDIYNVMGRLVQSVNITNANSVSVEELPAGIYTAHLYGGEYTAVKKFVKE